MLGSWAGGTPRGRGVVEAPGDCGCDARKIGRSRVHREHQHGRAGLPPRHRVLFSRSTILTDTEKLIPRPMIFTCYQGSLLGFPLSLSFWRAFCAYGNLERMNSFKSTAGNIFLSRSFSCVLCTSFNSVACKTIENFSISCPHSLTRFHRFVSRFLRHVEGLNW